MARDIERIKTEYVINKYLLSFNGVTMQQLVDETTPNHATARYAAVTTDLVTLRYNKRSPRRKAATHVCD